jgi:2',3'-cyclic-nucleotide 2'-phosphodiesterase (5'-nucleotidase family)
VLLLHAGDILSSEDPVTVYYGGEANIDLMNRVGYDAFTPGNGEFYWGPVASDNLLRLEKKAAFPFLHANIVYRETGEGVFKPYVVKTVAGCRVGILGLGAVRMENATVRNLKLIHPIECAKRYAPALRKECDVLVVLSHCALDIEQKLVQEVPGIDLVVGGHSHERLDPPVRMPKPDGTGSVVIAHAGDYEQYLGRLDVALERTGNTVAVSRVEGHLLPLDGSVAEDPDIGKLVAKYMDPLDRVICVAEAAVDNPQTGPSPMGCLVAEAVRDAARADVALLDRGSVRAGITPGPVTLADTVRIHPWRNHVVTAKLTGAELRHILDTSDLLVAARGEQSSERKVRLNVISRVPLDDARVYTVALGDYARNSTKALQDIAVSPTPYRVDAVLAEYLRKYKRITSGRTGIVVSRVPGNGAPAILYANCERASGPIVIDGKGDDAAWAKIAPITDFRLWKTFGKPTEGTTFRICYDDTNIYALFECADLDVFALYDTRDANLWESDVVELFLQPSDDRPIYYEFEVAPNNAVFDARMVNTGSGGFRRWAAWNCDIRTATQIQGTLNHWEDRDTGYTVEIAIPISAFKEVVGDAPLKGQGWRFAAVRADLSATLENEERSSTANVPDGDIHRKDGYSALIFR